MGLTNAELGLVLTTVAGSATALGAAVVFSERLVQLASKPFLAGALGLSSGVMLYVSFVEIFVKSLDGFADSSAFGDSDAYLMATAALFGGMGFMSGLCAVLLCFTFPFAFVLRLCKDDLGSREAALYRCLVPVTCVFAVAGTAASAADIVQHFDSSRMPFAC